MAKSSRVRPSFDLASFATNTVPVVTESPLEVLEKKLNALTEDNRRLLQQQDEDFTYLHLKDGSQMQFILQKIAAADIETSTIVPAINGRDQALLTREAVRDISQSLSVSGQFYPAIGNLNAQGQIEVLAGSRRRQACIYSDHDFTILVPVSAISLSDAQFIAEATNAQKELSVVELAQKWQLMLDSGEFSDQKALAAALGRSPATVTRILKAARIPRLWLLQIPDVHALSYAQIASLVGAAETLNAESVELISLELADVRKIQQFGHASNEELVTEVVTQASKAAKKLKEPAQKDHLRKQKETLFQQGSSSLVSTVVFGDNYRRKVQVSGTDLSKQQTDILAKYLELAAAEMKQNGLL
ncbi:MAG: ParB/RepB/Spo0J family partition protein [Plesiomonas sp.]|uniref:ParB/RepB/Spo0J family partition protein n=1 Tax=Plesiomonas sp. TaxID=2486279 RepID=UPI003EE8114E